MNQKRRVQAWPVRQRQGFAYLCKNLFPQKIGIPESPLGDECLSDLPETKVFSWGKAHVLFGLVCLLAIVTFLLVGVEGTSLAYWRSPEGNSAPAETAGGATADDSGAPVTPTTPILVSNVDELISELKKENLWEIEDLDRLPDVLVARFPDDLGAAAVPDKKRAFIVSVLSASKVVLDEVRQERSRLVRIVEALGGNPAKQDFSKENRMAWAEFISREDVAFLQTLTQKYRTENAAELLNRVNVLPLSLIIAQGAIESSWGGSRFASQANNLFGMWTWGKKGLVPARRDPDKLHKIAMYDSIVDSVRAYVLTINRVSAYDTLRRIRRETLDSFALSEGLLRYSERKEFYVQDVKRVIEANNLKAFDGFLSEAT